MSYDIFIGNAKPEHSKDDGYLSARWRVEPVRHDSAPTFPHDEMTGSGNSRHPGYSAWADFLRDTGLYTLFLGDGGLMTPHPGCNMLTEENHVEIKAALDKWRLSHNLPPGFSGLDYKTGREVDTGQYDAILARLIWLEYWVRWALDNCEAPAIENY